MSMQGLIVTQRLAPIIEQGARLLLLHKLINNLTLEGFGKYKSGMVTSQQTNSVWHRYYIVSIE